VTDYKLQINEMRLGRCSGKVWKGFGISRWWGFGFYLREFSFSLAYARVLRFGIMFEAHSE
jgi:hypothetical protein